MRQPRHPALLFDLDGTLTDPYEGITRTFGHTLNTLGKPLPDAETLRSWIGPPLRASLRAYLGDDTLAEEAVTIYRERYLSIGMYENQLYEGIPELLAELQASGIRLYVATSKFIIPAQGILDHFGLTRFFVAIIGSTPDDRIGTKAEVIGAVLDLLSPTERSASLMIGDTVYDIEGARAHSLPCIAVTYGYGTLDELTEANPHALVHSVADLRDLLCNKEDR
ncbi:HAD hydrolase-like protein [Candidatus Chloroploca sp. M-50]|uniref:HAD hydrolase-like protein n=1 Tax=Candidatus Chloroploca mongolica TaxID=2528176 RepID=A0ABS4DEK1_9CHLR|nr:HAD hydrolase-like protein [Candidatus Chloroploca mongolica]MBP1467862.1 HAD hydrolase-like protein [Candidatus Chloroploca mongolica]